MVRAECACRCRAAAMAREPVLWLPARMTTRGMVVVLGWEEALYKQG